MTCKMFAFLEISFMRALKKINETARHLLLAGKNNRLFKRSYTKYYFSSSIVENHSGLFIDENSP